MKKQISQALCVLFFCVFSLMFLSGCAETPREDIIYTTRGYSAPVLQLFPGYKVAEYNVNFSLLALQNGGVIEAYDAQEQNKVAKYWYPLTLETVVIAMDRNKTDMPVTSWEDLLSSDTDVGIMDVRPFDRLTMAAMCYGLEGENFGLAAAVKILKPLHQSGKLKRNDRSASIQICFDSDAAARIRNGENIEIVIPSEGTLSYVKGLLSNTPLDFPDNTEQVLTEHGLRLPDGRCDETIYPAAEKYAPASLLIPNSSFLTHFNTVMQNWTKVMRREVLHIRLYSSVDGFEHVMFPTVFIIFAVIWAVTMMRRVRQKNIRRVILMMGLLLAAWILARVLKYQAIETNALTRYLWYSYYLFQSLLTLGLLRIASLVGASDEKKQIPKWFLTIGMFNLVLAGLAMTNDMHNWMFILDLSTPGWSGNYGQGFFYYFFIVALLTELIGSIILMSVKSRYNPRRSGMFFPLAFIAALIIYLIGYAARIPFFWDSDITLVMCVFGLLFMECCIRVGQIPVNVHYRELFKNAGLKLQITDDGGRSILASNDAEPLNSDQWSVISGRDVVQIDENTLLRKNKISGGYAVWREDITVINKIKAELEASNKSLVSANSTLSHIAHAKEQAAQIKARTELYAAVERDIAGHEQRIAEMLRKTPEHEAERAAHMGIIAMLVCYIKRRCQLLLSEIDGNRDMDFNDLLIYFDELIEIARPAGIEGLIFCAFDGKVNIRYAALFYDFLDSVLEWSAVHLQGKMIIQIVSENNRITMKLLMGHEALAFEPPEQAARKIDNAEGLFEKEDLEDMTGILLSFPAQSCSAEVGECGA